MQKQIISSNKQLNSGYVLGYSDREAKLQIALLHLKDVRVCECECMEFWSTHELMGYLVEQPRPLGIGAYATLALSTGREGWRAADYWIDEAPFHHKSEYDEFPFYWGPHQFCGNRSLSAIAMLSAMRRRWPDLPATETDPGECYQHLTWSTESPDLSERIWVLSEWMGVRLPSDLGEAGWEAVMSAYAMWMGLRGDWPIDLFRLTRPGGKARVLSFGDGVSKDEEYTQPELSAKTLIFPAGPVSFFWPPDDRADVERNGEFTI